MHSNFLQLSALVFSFLVGVFSFYRKSISVSGFAALMFISGMFIWANELGLLFALFYMFASSSLLTKYKKHRKKEFESVVGKTGPRDYVQALCNLGVATFGMMLYVLSPHDALVAAILGSIAAANADSWASEIGGLSTRQPILITNFKPTTKGVSGGITMLGTFGGVAGSLFIVVAGVLTMQALTPFGGTLWILAGASFVAGVVGFVFDSYLGAFSQALYQDRISGQFTEKPSSDVILVKGISWLNNDMVNFISSLVGALVAGMAYLCADWYLSNALSQ